MGFGTPHRHYARTDSTNARARELAAAGAPHGTVVTADEQTAGRGRQGRAWIAPAGRALLYSALVRPLEERHLLLPLAVPLAVAETAEELAPGVRCGLKWPNDVLVGRRKLAGVLIEARPNDGWAVLGIGLNLTTAAEELPADLRATATSLKLAATASKGPEPEQGLEPARVADAVGAMAWAGVTARAKQVLSRRLERWLGAEAPEVLAAWRARDALRGREVAWDGGSGVAEGIDDRGHLVVRTAAGERVAVGAGEVHLSRA